MKRFLPIVLCCLFGWQANAQLVLRSAYTPANGRHHFELTNNSTGTHDIGCYTLVSFYKVKGEEGFYVINLPRNRVASQGLLTISASEPITFQPTTNHLNLSLQELHRTGLLRKYTWNRPSKSLISADGFRETAFTMLPNENVNDHLVLLLNNNTLEDASFRVDAQERLSSFFRELPNLSFTNSCGNPVTVRFGSLQQLFPSVFDRNGEQRTTGYFNGFEIRRNNAQVQIAWQTVREQGNRGFEIERRSDRQNWTTIGFVASQATSGSSDQTLQYLYTDRFYPGSTQYRLKQIDLSGRSTYSPVRIVDVFGEDQYMVAYPNPSFDGRVNVSFNAVNSPRDIQLIDLNGQVLQQWIAVNNSTQQFNNLRSGNYVIRVIDRQSGRVHTEKVIVRN